jgi:hypothetical protein
MVIICTAHEVKKNIRMQNFGKETTWRDHMRDVGVNGRIILKVI